MLTDDEKVMIKFMQQEILDVDVIPCEDQKGFKRIPPNFKIPYSEIPLFEDTGAIIQFIKRNYKVSIYVGLMGSKIYSVYFVYGTGAGRNRIQEGFIEGEWLKAIRRIADQS